MREFFEKYKLSFDPLTIANIVLGIVLIINPEFSTRLILAIVSGSKDSLYFSKNSLIKCSFVQKIKIS